MNRHEFELRTHVDISDAEFEQINDMYINSGDKIDKDTFCKDWKEHKDSVLLNTFFDQSERLRDKLDLFRDKMYNAASILVAKAHVYDDPDLRKEAVRLLDERRVVLLTMKLGLFLWEDDIKYIQEHLS